MCVCVCMYICEYVCILMYTHTRTYTYIYIYICICVDIYIYVFKDSQVLFKPAFSTLDSTTPSLPTLCNLMDCGLPDSSVHGINQARILEWVVTQWYSIKWFSKCCLETNVSLSFEVQCSQLTITVIVESYCPSTKKMQ